VQQGGELVAFLRGQCARAACMPVVPAWRMRSDAAAVGCCPARGGELDELGAAVVGVRDAVGVAGLLEPLYAHTSLRGNSGIGCAAALGLAGLGEYVVLTGRDPSQPSISARAFPTRQPRRA
jgi:hypothetical protein